MRISKKTSFVFLVVFVLIILVSFSFVFGQGCDEDSDCINGQCGGGTCGGTGVTVDLAVVKIEPVQVIKDVDLVKGKFGIVRVTVTNYGLNQSNGLVNVTFDGTQLSIASGDTQIKNIPPNRNITFDF